MLMRSDRMHSRLMIFVWRRKIFVLGSSILFLIALWCWGLFYTTFTTNDNKLMSIRELDSGGRHENLLYKLGLTNFQLKSTYNQYKNSNNNQNNNNDNKVKFLQPTGESYIRRDNKYSQLDALLLDKDTENLLRNLEMPSRDEIGRKRLTEQLRLAAEKETHYEHELQRMGIPVIAGLGPGGHSQLNQRLVHFDLKGAPPKISYLKRMMSIMKSLGATGILLEYEDMFPYSGTIGNISAKNAYTIKEIRELLHSAASVGLSVMPLVQTFGHLEFALKLKQYEDLREVDESPQSLCPSLNSSMSFLEEMITQVIEAHKPLTIISTSIDETGTQADPQTELLPTFTHLHIGCDEVFRMAECSRCKSKSRDTLFLSHVAAVATMIKKRWPELKLVIWDDMLRHMSLSDMQDSNIGSLVEPMVWVYAEDIYRFISSQIWDKFATIFPTAWIASAYKGAHGETLLLPPSRRHLENTLRWLAVAQSEGARFSQGIQGIALTGWQRYDHFAVLCELFPSALPTLALCLSAASRGYFEVDAKHNPVLSALTCSEPSPESLARRPWIELIKDTNLQSFSRCMFPGSALFRYVIRVTAAIQETKDYLDLIKYNRGWLTDYNINHNYSSPIRVEELSQETPRLINALTSMAKSADESMSEIYDEWTITEFIEQRIYPLVNELKKLEKNTEMLKSKRQWPQRPLPYLKELQKYDLLPQPNH